MTPARAIQCRVNETVAEDHRGGPSNISAELYKRRRRRGEREREWVVCKDGGRMVVVE
jgi:hypothetical protein